MKLSEKSRVLITSFVCILLLSVVWVWATQSPVIDPTYISNPKFVGDEYWLGSDNVTDVLAYPEQAASYIIFKDDSTYKAKNGTTGQIDYSGTNVTAIWENVRDNGLNSGRTWDEKVVFMGNWTIDSVIEVPSHTFLDCILLNMVKTQKTGFITNMNKVSGNSHITIIGGKWDGNSNIETDTSDYGFHFYKVDNLKVEDVKIHNCGFHGIVISNVNNSKFEDISFWPITPKDGMKILGNCHHIIINGIEGTALDNILSICSDDYTTNLNAYGDAGNISDITIRDIYIEQNADHACEFRIIGSSNYSIRDIVVEGLNIKFPSGTSAGRALMAFDETSGYMSGDGLLNLEDITIKNVYAEGDGATSRLLRFSGSNMKKIRVENIQVHKNCYVTMVYISGGKDVEIDGIKRIGTSTNMISIFGGNTIDKLTVRNIQTSNDQIVFYESTNVTDLKIYNVQRKSEQLNNFITGTPGLGTNILIDGMEFKGATAYCPFHLLSEIRSVTIKNTKIEVGQIAKNTLHGSEIWTLENVEVYGGSRIMDITSGATDVTLVLNNVIFSNSALQPFYLNNCTIKIIGTLWRNEAGTNDFSYNNNPDIKVNHPHIQADVGELSSTPDTYDMLIQVGGTMNNGLVQFNGTVWVNLWDGTTWTPP